jgi:hypothetical protein
MPETGNQRWIATHIDWDSLGHQTNSKYRWNWGYAAGGGSGKRREPVRGFQLTVGRVINNLLEHAIGLSESDTMHRVARAEN